MLRLLLRRSQWLGLWVRLNVVPLLRATATTVLCIRHHGRGMGTLRGTRAADDDVSGHIIPRTHPFRRHWVAPALIAVHVVLARVPSVMTRVISTSRLFMMCRRLLRRR
jgi:hypothetical protein